MWFYVVASFLLLAGADTARILGVFPMPSVSHQVVFRALTLELAKRGHELVIITPNPAFPKDRPKDNVTEIDVGYSYEVIMNLTSQSFPPVTKRGVISNVEAMYSQKVVESMFYPMTEIFNSDEVNELIQDKSQHFDLIIAEAFMSFQLIFSKIFNAPVIWISSFYGFPGMFKAVGAVTMHPIFHPHIFRSTFRDLTLFDKLREIYNEYRLSEAYRKIEITENALLKTKFGKDAPTVQELKKNVCMLLLNTFPLFDNNRPVPPSVIYLGAIHLQPVKDLPKDLKNYLDNSTRGVVYVSLGSNIRPSLMAKDLLDVFLEAFESLPYDILWKFDGDSLENIPKNLVLQKWFPQRDLLVHPNVKAFVTQAGLQSTDEAIDSGVPLVGIPMLADQWYNANKYVELGFGIQLNGYTMTTEDLVMAVQRVITDDRQNIKRVKTLVYDQPLRPLERAVWWTEHVLRHGGAKHLQSPAANMSWTEYLMADVVLVLVSVLFALVIVLIYISNYIFSLFKLNQKVKVKNS